MSYEIEIEKACEEGDLARVRGLYQSIASSAPEDGTLEMMILTAAENNHPDLVRFCIEQGAEASHDVITEAYDLPEVAKVLITTGAMDVNYDYEMAGDLLINAVYARQVSHPRHPPKRTNKKLSPQKKILKDRGGKKGKKRPPPPPNSPFPIPSANPIPPPPNSTTTSTGS